MSGWLRALAVGLVLIAVWLVIRQVGIFGFRPFGAPRERPPGPPIVGARGRLAYIRSGDLFTFDLRDGTERRLTQSRGVRSPRWSGAGNWIAFERDGRLLVAGQDGTGVVDVPGGDLPASATWSPSGARLAYASLDGSLSTFDPALRANQRRVLVPTGSGVGEGIVWTSDGIRLAYERHQRAGPNTSNEGIWTITDAGRDPLPVFVASGDVSLTLCCWTYSSAFLFFWQAERGAAATDGAPLFAARSGSSQPAQVIDLSLPIRSWADRAPRTEAMAFVAGGGRAATDGKRLIVALPVAPGRTRRRRDRDH